MDPLLNLINQFQIVSPEDIGYFTIFVAFLLDGLSVPFTPIELFLGLAGYLSAVGELRTYAALLLTVIGSMCGHIISYLVGYMLGRPFVHTYGKYIFLSPEQLIRVEQKAKRFGILGAFVLRFIPGVRSVASLFLGITKTPFLEFLLLTLPAVILLNSFYFVIGYYFGVTFAAAAVWIVPFVSGAIVAGLGIAVFVGKTQSRHGK